MKHAEGPICFVALIGLVLLASPSPASAQAYFYGFGTNPWSVPIPVTGGYVDAANGNLHIEIPVASIAERGHVPYMAKLVYDSHFWQQVTSNGSTSWQPTNVPGLPTTWGGWRLMTSAGTGGGVTYTMSSNTCYYYQGPIKLGQFYIQYSNFNWTAPDGHTIPFGGSTISTSGNHCESSSPNYSGISRDASGYHISVTNYTTAVVYAPDGTQVYPNVKDTNGNYYSAPNSNGDVTDTRGQTPITTVVNGSTITYEVQSSEGSYNIVVTTEPLAVNTLFGVSNVTEYSGNITVIESIELPDNTTYQFGYDHGSTGTHFGTLTSMTLPTTGTIDYSHSLYTDAYSNPYLYLESYTLVGSGTWSFAPQVLTTCGTTCSQQVTVTRPSADQERYTFTMYSGSMWETLSASYNGAVSSANLLQSTAITYNTSNPPYIQPVTYQTTAPVPGGTLTNQVTLTYDTNNFGNVLNRNEWNFYPTLPSSPDRTYSYTYLSNSDNNMVNKRSETKLTSGSSTLSDTVVTYDSYGSNGLTTVSNVVGHDDTNFGSSYTARGNPTSISYSSLASAAFTYDTTGQVLTSQDSNSNTTTLSYADCYLNDALPPTNYTPSALTNAFPTKVTLPITGSINLCYYWGSGKLATVKDQNGAITASHFLDSLARHTHVIRPLGWTEWNYSSNETEVDAYTGITATSPTMNCSSSGSCRHDATYLDSFGRFSDSQLVNDPDGSTTISSIVYDSSGRIKTSANPYRTTSDPTYGVETPSYDGLNRVTQVKHADNDAAKVYYGAAVSNVTGANTTQLCSYSYSGYGYPTVSVDEAGNMRETWTDGFGRTIEVDEPVSTGNLTSNTCYSYTEADYLASVSHTVGSQQQLRSYGHDSLGRVYQIGTPESLGTNYYYTKSGGGRCSGNPANVCWKKDGRSITTTYTYDALNRLTGISYSDGVTPAVTYCYDNVNNFCASFSGANGLGRRTAMKDGSGNTAWSYDADGRIVTEQRTIAGITKTISYAYNGDGSISSVTYPSGRKVSYVVGNVERALSATDAAGTQYAVTASYAAAGALSAVMYGKITGGFNGFSASQNFDKRWDLTSIQATSSAGTALNVSYCFYPLVSGACPATGPNNNGNVGVMTNNKDTGRTETFSYDYLSRIASATTQATSGADCWGQSFVADALANLTTVNSTQTGCSIWMLSVSANVTTNQLSFTPAPSYDNAGNMTGDGTYTYTFDAENRITATTASSISYSYDGNGMRVEKSGQTLYWRATTGDVLAETDTSGNTKNEYVYFAGRRIAWWDSLGNSYYVYADALGTTRTIAESNGTVCYDADFTPYGQEIQHTNTCPSTYNYKFTGYERDSETGLDYAFARYYSSRFGRFMSPDPVAGGRSNPQSLNRYAYVVNNPTNWTDPLGLHCPNYEVCPIDWIDPSYSGEFGGVGWIGMPYWVVYASPSCDWENGDNPSCDFGAESGLSMFNSGGGGGGSTDPCANIAGKGGVVPFPTPYGTGRFEFDSSSFLIGFALPLTGSSGQNVQGFQIAPYTLGGARLNSPGNVSIGFNNPIQTPGLIGSYIQSATFSGGQFTSVIGAVAVAGVPLGSTSTPSPTVQNNLNQNSSAIETGNSLLQLLEWTSKNINCETLAGGKQ